MADKTNGQEMFEKLSYKKQNIYENCRKLPTNIQSEDKFYKSEIFTPVVAF